MNIRSTAGRAPWKDPGQMAPSLVATEDISPTGCAVLSSVSNGH
jgi:hypothetical protein